MGPEPVERVAAACVRTETRTTGCVPAALHRGGSSIAGTSAAAAAATVAPSQCRDVLGSAFRRVHTPRNGTTYVALRLHLRSSLRPSRPWVRGVPPRNWEHQRRGPARGGTPDRPGPEDWVRSRGTYGRPHDRLAPRTLGGCWRGPPPLVGAWRRKEPPFRQRPAGDGLMSYTSARLHSAGLGVRCPPDRRGKGGAGPCGKGRGC